MEVLDRGLWEYPMDSLDDYVAALRAAFEGRKQGTLSFGSVRATLSEISICNSSGLRTGYGHTTVDVELGVKASGGPEGAAPQEILGERPGRTGFDRRSSARTGRGMEPFRGRCPARETPTDRRDSGGGAPGQCSQECLPTVFGGRFTGTARLRPRGPGGGNEAGLRARHDPR